jgi:uncharacterized membrane protein YozB (DUF420 family)
LEGFFGTQAPFLADVNLLLQVLMGLALIAGAMLARKKRFREHAVCQTVVLLLNLVPIGLVMGPSFHSRIAPLRMKRFHHLYYAVAMAHGVGGVIAELMGLYILLAAGTDLLPQRLRVARWKLWMRAEIVLWWSVLVLGFWTYSAWYVVR